MKVFLVFSIILIVVLVLLQGTESAPNKKKCGENEEFLACGTSCEPNCIDGMVLFCTKQCVIDVCQCKHGFYRNKDKKCVSRNKC
ncbi:unnamed protein product [Caenorhabditis angaria]|uniref:TIL domain-containing protein n=1 Tax=Caenorhabditis angaria TaxID=860376 RepID=A0A9P1N834_9PELO|nr:unnamed protein product [Caenorhabditis angaria]